MTDSVSSVNIFGVAFTFNQFGALRSRGGFFFSVFAAKVLVLPVQFLPVQLGHHSSARTVKQLNISSLSDPGHCCVFDHV